MRLHVLVFVGAVAVLSVCSCSGPGAADPGAVARAGEKSAGAGTTEPKKKAGEIVISPESQRTGGIEVQVIQPAAIGESISATGQLTVNEDQTWTVGALLDGRVVSVAVNVGDRVNSGQVLAHIHSHDVHEARAAFKSADLELARARMAASYAQRVRDRAKRLLDLRAGSQQEMEAAEAELRNAQTAVRDAQVKVDKEKAHITEFLDVPLEDDDSRRGDPNDYVPVKAPASGVVIDRKATAGTVVSTGHEMFRITTTSSLWMTANVNEADLGKLRVGMPVRIFVRAYPDRPLSGRVLRLGEQLDPTTRTLQVRVFVQNDRGMLKPEMFATAEIGSGSTEQKLFIPEAAAQDFNGARVVFVRTAADRFELRPVEIRRTLNGMAEVVNGIRAGEAVAVKGSFILKSQMLKGSLEEGE